MYRYNRKADFIFKKEDYNILKRDIADDLFSIVVKRYHEEKPDVELSNEMMDKIWFSLYGKLNHDGKEVAYEYARTAKLLW